MAKVVKCDLASLEPVLTTRISEALAEGEQELACFKAVESGMERVYILTERKVISAQRVGAFGLWSQPAVQSIRLDEVTSIRGPYGSERFGLGASGGPHLSVDLTGDPGKAAEFRKAIENRMAQLQGQGDPVERSLEQRLRRLKNLYDQGLIPEAEYQLKRKQILDEI